MTQRDRQQRWSSSLRDQFLTLALAAAIALAVRLFVIEPFVIPSESMLPTLLVGDHLFVNKFVYGSKVPFTDVRLPSLREPARGDVVVFTVAGDGHETFPADERPDLPREQFVKRIVGLPGDRIAIDEGRVSINGTPMRERGLEQRFEDQLGQLLDVREVSLAGGPFRILDDPDAEGPLTADLVVPDDRYFMMGDNRDYSKDSRVWGTVRKQEFRGRAFVLYWSWDFRGEWHALASPARWWELLTDRMRWDRVGAAIE